MGKRIRCSRIHVYCTKTTVWCGFGGTSTTTESIVDQKNEETASRLDKSSPRMDCRSIEISFRTSPNSICMSPTDSIQLDASKERNIIPTAFNIQSSIPHPRWFGDVSDEGVGGLYFVQGTVNAQVYIGILKKLLPTIRDHFISVENVIFQDDSAPCHRSKLLSNNLKTFILPLDLN